MTSVCLQIINFIHAQACKTLTHLSEIRWNSFIIVMYIAAKAGGRGAHRTLYIASGERVVLSIYSPTINPHQSIINQLQNWLYGGYERKVTARKGRQRSAVSKRCLYFS